MRSQSLGYANHWIQVSLINIYLVGLTGDNGGDGGTRVRDTSLGQFLILSFFFVFASLLGTLLKFW